ncbi:MAG: DUF4321 domain-containing protein [Lachnospiraceae bacterium]|nr:DUF4321 domain-containing protein [Lachnospiraceae bacterium]
MKGKNNVVCLLLVLAGLVIGGFVGQLTSGISYLSWLNYGQSFGTDSPLVLNLGILVFTVGLTIRISISSILGIILGVLIYRNI